MKRRNLLKSLAILPLATRAFASAAPTHPVAVAPPAIIAAGSAGMHTVWSGYEYGLPQNVPNVALGTNKYLMGYMEDCFDSFCLLDEDFLPGPNGRLASSVALEEAQLEAIVSFLSPRKDWLIVGSLIGGTGSVMLPLLARYAAARDVRAHVFGIGPFVGEFPADHARGVEEAVMRYAASSKFVWNSSVLGNNATFGDVLDAVDKQCQEWIAQHCAAATG